MGLAKSHKILYMATYPPRECGIATFTEDLTSAIDKKFNPLIGSRILAMNDSGTSIYNYNKKVTLQINDNDIGDYIEIAKKINHSANVRLVNIQHEFGIFGGDYGNYLVPFLEALAKPVIITFHSVLPEPDEQIKRLVQLIAERTTVIIVMTKRAADILINEYGLKPQKIAVIPHGIPEVAFCHPDEEKPRLGLQGRLVASTFGMLSRNKGIQYAIRSLPPVVAKYPNLLYLIIGETHPQVRKHEGEEYRNFLEREIEKLGLQDNVKFYNKYLTLDEIISYLKATDVYILPSLDPCQAVSGTLVYAMGAGRPVISTAFEHAREIIADERGGLAKFKDPASITRHLFRFLDDEKLRQEASQNAYAFSRFMTWPNVAIAYMDLFRRHIDLPQNKRAKLPPLKLKHLRTLTDDFGIIQFAERTVPDLQYGYCLDDNAMALIVACRYAQLYQLKPVLPLLKTYLNFIQFCQKANGEFHNLVSQERIFSEETNNQDSQGRALWALGYLLKQESLPMELKNFARKIFNNSLTNVSQLKAPRAVAFAIAGLSYANQAEPNVQLIDLLKRLADYLVDLYQNQVAHDWQWFEPQLTYSNSKLAEALYYAYLATKDKKYLEVAEQAFNFLLPIYFVDGAFAPIGQDGWYYKEGKRAHFDQQPEDAGSMVETLALAYQATKKKDYRHKAHRAFKWFLGDNHLQQVVYDEVSGGCHDGLGKHSLNLNEGAESTIAYLLARLTLENL